MKTQSNLVQLLVKQGSLTIDESRSLSFKGLLQGLFAFGLMYAYIVVLCAL